MQIKFAKYEGAGNDFIMLDLRQTEMILSKERIARLCDRHFGIGADGLMTLRNAPDIDSSMRYYNADGSEGEMCGNGARCFALFAHHLSIGGEVKHFDAADGRHLARILSTDGQTGMVELGMTDVDAIRIGEGWWFLNTGVPHYVEFVKEVDAVEVRERGRAIRYDTARFPQGTNVNFVEITGDGTLRMRTYERGVETETLACGTGATAAAIVANYVFQHQRNHYRITVPGGGLSVEFSHPPGSAQYRDIRLSGPARSVFGGSFDTDNF